MHFDNYQELQAALDLPPLEPGAFRFARPWSGSTFRCDECGEAKPLFNANSVSISTGYARYAQDRMVCYECCGKLEAAELQKTGKGCLYLTDKTLSNWPGTLKIPVHYMKTGRHNMAGRRYDVWFTFQGAEWHGVQYGDNTQICRVRRLKR